MRFLRLRGRKTCDRLLRLGKVWKGTTLTVRYMAGAPRHPSSIAAPAFYIGTLASTKLDKSAVRRNRMRRRCREALRILAKDIDIPSSYQLLLAPRSSSLKAPFDRIQQDLRVFLSFLSHGRSQEARQ